MKNERSIWNDIVPAPASVSVDEAFAVPIPRRITVAAESAELAAGIIEIVELSLGEFDDSGSVDRGDAAVPDAGRGISVMPVQDGGERAALIAELESGSAAVPDPAADVTQCSDERWTLSCHIDDATNAAAFRIRAAGYRGAMRAAAALAQAIGRAVRLSRADRAGASLPSAELAGVPRYPWRGFMLDCVRHMFPVALVTRLIDQAALHGLNVFHWHLSDDQGWRLPSEAYPVLEKVAAWRDDNTTHYGSYGGVYSASEIRDVVEHAARRGIVVVPEIDVPGHVSSVLAAMPELSCTGKAGPVPIRHGIFEDVLCAGNPDAHRFLKTVFSELCELFPGPFIHLGGDECPSTRWEACPKCRARAEELGLSDVALLHGDLVCTAVQTIEAHDRRAVGWDEVLESDPPQGVLVMCWRAHECAERAIAAGHDVILCPTDRACYFDHKPLDDPREPGWLGVCTIRDTYRFRPVRDTVDAPSVSANESGGPAVLGSQGNLWTEQIRFGREAEYMLWPRLAALAEVLWGTAGRGEGDEERILRHASWLRSIDIKSYDGPAG